MTERGALVDRGPPLRPVHGPWPVLLLCCAVVGVGAGPGFLLGYVGPALMRELGVGRFEVGLLVGLFFGSTGLTSMLASHWAGPLGARACLVLSMTVAAGACLAMGLFASLPVLVVAAALAGAAYAFGNVGTNLAVVAAVPSGRSASALTLKTAGVPVVATVLALAAGWTQATDWRPVVFGLAIAAALVGVALGVVLPRVPHVAGASRREAVLHRSFWLLPLAAFLFIAGSQPLQSFLLTYLHEALGMSVGRAGAVAAAGTLVGVVAMLVVSRIADRVGAARRAPLVASLCLLGAVAGAIILAGPVWPALAVAGALVGLSCNLSIAGLSHVVVVDRARTAVGRASGFTLVGYYLGALVSPLGFGYLADVTGDYLLAWAVCSLFLVVAAVVYAWAQRVVPLSPVEG